MLELTFLLTLIVVLFLVLYLVISSNNMYDALDNVNIWRHVHQDTIIATLPKVMSFAVMDRLWQISV